MADESTVNSASESNAAKLEPPAALKAEMEGTLDRSSADSENIRHQTPTEHEENTTQIEVGPNENQTRFDLHSQELFVFRWTLRLLSLWCPATACLAERLFYPVLVNTLLLLIIASDVYVLITGAWKKSLDIYVFLAIDGGMYTSHLFGLFYFRSRDLENNIFEISLNDGFADELRKKLKRLKVGIILSYLLLGALVLLFFNTEAWLHGRFKCNSSFKFLHGIASNLVCLLNYPTNIYGVGNSLALSWTMFLLHQICCARLKQLAKNYFRWTGTAEEAVYDHLTEYSRKVKESCVNLEKWFLTHNFILIIATPFLCTDIIDGFKAFSRPKSNPLHTSLFVGFLVYTVVIWVAPLYFAEQLQNHDEELCTQVNEFCPGTFQEREPVLHAELHNSPDASNPNQACRYTFHSRTEVNKFLSYLKNRKSGFLMGSYSFQFKLSMLSVFLAIFAFATRTVG